MKTKAQKRTEAQKNAEALKAQKKTARDAKMKVMSAPANGKKASFQHRNQKVKNKTDFAKRMS